jgi:hypothetical protein
VPEEEAEFIAHLARSGKVWAFAWSVDPSEPERPPAPVAEFFRDHGAAMIRAYQEASARSHAENAAYWAEPTARRPHRTTWGQEKNRVYLGLRETVLAPRVREFESLEGGWVEPSEVAGALRIVGGTPVLRRTIDRATPLLQYDRGGWLEHHQAIDGANLFYENAKTDAEFQRLGRQVLAWLRRWTPESVKVSNANYEKRATKGAGAASRAGTKFVS